MTMNQQHKGDEWTIAAWILAGLAVVLLVASLSGSGNGMFDSGFMGGWTWLSGVLPFLFVALLALLIGERIRDAR